MSTLGKDSVYPQLALSALSLFAPAPSLGDGGETETQTQTRHGAHLDVELRLTSADEGPAKLLEQLLWRRLSERLLQDGYRVVPTGESAGLRVWVHVQPQGARVEARGVERLVEAVPPGEPELVALEVQQLTTALLDELQALATQPAPAPRPAPSADSPTVALVLSESLERAEPRLRERLQVALLDRGLALTRSPTLREPTICVTDTPAAYGVAVVQGVQACAELSPGTGISVVRATDAPAAGEPDALVDAAQRALETAAPPPEPKPEFEPERAPDPEPKQAPEPEPEPADPRSLTLSVHGGLLVRTAADGVFGLRLRGGHRLGPGGGVELSLATVGAGDLRVVDSFPAGVFDWSLDLGSAGPRARGFLSLGVYAGPYIHHYRYADVSQSGLRVRPNVGASVELGLLGPKTLVSSLRLRVGWLGGGLAHVGNSRTQWSRSALAVGLEGSLGSDFALGTRRAGARHD